MTYSEKWARLKIMIAASAFGFSVCVIVWAAGFYIADYVLHLRADSWRMLFGYFVGSIGITAMRALSGAIKGLPNT